MMPGTERASRRAVIVIALLVLTGIALRGYLPGEDRSSDDEPTNSPLAMIAVITLLAAAVVIIAVAVIATLREPRTPRPVGGQLADSPEGDRKRPSWRYLLIMLGVLLAWLLAVVLLMRLSVRLDIGDPPTTTVPSSPAPPATQAPPPEPPPPEDETQGDLFWPLVAITVFMLVVWAAGLVVALRRQQRGPAPRHVRDEVSDLPQPPAPQSLAVAAERGLAAMGDLSREPREAIIACYAAMERALADAPEAVPQDSDTPSEVLARAVEHHAVRSGSATELVDLFAEARFSPHVMNEGHREVAVRTLERVLTELRSPV